MKDFLIKSLCFLILVTLFNTLVAKISNNVYFKNYLIEPPKEYNNFLLADSHGLPIKKSSENHRVYNYSASSESYLDMLRKLRFLLRNNYTIDTIYLTVDDHTLSTYREWANNDDRSVFFTNKSDYNNNYDYFKNRLFKTRIVLFQPKVASIFKIYLIANLKSLTKQEKSEKNVSWSALEKRKKVEKSKNRKQDQFPNRVRSEELQNDLMHIIDLCRREDITLIGVKFPLSKDYLNQISELNYGADSIFKDNSLEIRNYKFLYFDNDEKFENPDHLTFQAGEQFSNILFHPN